MRAFIEVDLKKVVAFSTLSQLRIMIIRLRAGIVKVAFFHLIVHAVLKSTLFIGAGYLIHSLKGLQDSRGVRGFKIGRPLLIVFVGGSNLCLLGFPFIAGFYSKDMIVERLGRERLRFLVMLIV